MKALLSSYRKKYTHVLSGDIRRKNLAKAANGKSNFKGFRKVRKINEHTKMSYWALATNV